MIVGSGGRIRNPTLTGDFQFETELVVAMKSGGVDIPADRANDHIYGYAVGQDRPSLQGAAWPEASPACSP